MLTKTHCARRTVTAFSFASSVATCSAVFPFSSRAAAARSGARFRILCTCVSIAWRVVSGAGASLGGLDGNAVQWLQKDAMQALSAYALLTRRRFPIRVASRRFSGVARSLFFTIFHYGEPLFLATSASRSHAA